MPEGVDESRSSRLFEAMSPRYHPARASCGYRRRNNIISVPACLLRMRRRHIKTSLIYYRELLVLALVLCVTTMLHYYMLREIPTALVCTPL